VTSGCYNIFGEMERVYSGREYIEGIRESEEWNGKGRRIREGKV